MSDDRVTISYDPATGRLEFSAPKDHLGQASAEAQLLIKTAHACLLPSAKHSPAPAEPSKAHAEPRKEDKPASKVTKKAAPSAVRPGRIGSFEKVDFALSEDQERAIHDYYQARRPTEQGQQVAVAMYIGAKVTGKTGFDYNEIYTLLHLGGERELPKALDVVIGRMTDQLWIGKEGRLYILKFQARDFVEKLQPTS